MRKKYVIVITSLIIILILSMGLVGCIPSRPDKFVVRLLASEKWGIISINDKGVETSVIARNGNMRMDIGAKGSTCLVAGKNAIEMYRFENEVWTYEIIKKADQVELLRKEILNSNVIDSNVVDGLDLKYVRDDFETKYEKIDGKWYERNTMPASLYVKGSSLVYEKNSKIVKYIINYKIELPPEAKQAKKDYLNK